MDQLAALFAEQASEGGDSPFFVFAPNELRHRAIRPAFVVVRPATEFDPRGAGLH